MRDRCAIAETLSPATAEAYNGQQGDIWDPHKDIALAVLGAVITVLAIAGRQRAARGSSCAAPRSG